MGTPSYMAPEQAAGEYTKLSNATDVYGLGAVLYQLLTGHPPFAGSTTYEIIKLLLDSEPRPPRLLNPKIDRELSTICLKCLEKDPRRRYSSALALAEDLEHWLKHEPIRAHRTGIFSRGRKWVRRKPAIAAVITLSLALAVAIAWNVWKSEFTRHPVTNGVAVLPFENIGSDPENAYFAEGIQEEILTRLASIADLKVISRTSTQQYQNKPRNLAEIAKQLGVANILEGSVQKATDQVRVNVQLINAQTDSHLWAETYDRKLTDIFGVESDIAKRIAESLQAKLTAREEQALAVKPTNNIEAYDAYLRGVAFEARSGHAPSSEAIGFYERAVQLDPNFAVAWAHLSEAHGHFYFDHDATSGRRDATKRALENAQKLEPNSPETLLALGYYQHGVLRDLRLAKTTFGRVSKILPGSSAVQRALAFVAQSEGHWDESIAYLEQALILDPRDTSLLGHAAETFTFLRQFSAALNLYDRWLEIRPNDLHVMAEKASVYQAQGNLQEAAKWLSGIDGQAPDEAAFQVKITQLRLERNFGEAVRLLRGRLDHFHFDSEYDKAIDQVNLAFIQRLAGDAAGAKVTADEARKTLQQLYSDQPDGDLIALQLSRAHAATGEKDSALKLAERAITLRPRAQDAVNGPILEENLAQIQMMFGANSPAIAVLTQLLQTPSYSLNCDPAPITPALLKLDPIWDPLRDDPAFQKLCEEKQP